MISDEDTYEQVIQETEIQDHQVTEAVATDDVANQIREDIIEQMGQATVVVYGGTQNTNHYSSQESNRLKTKHIIGACLGLITIISIIIVVGVAVGIMVSKKKSDNISEEELYNFLKSNSPNNGTALDDKSSPQYKAFSWLYSDISDSFVTLHQRRQRRKLERRTVQQVKPQRQQKEQQHVLNHYYYNEQIRRTKRNDDEEVLQKDDLLERYAMATLFYSTATPISVATNGHFTSGWDQYDGWLTGSHICDWYSSSVSDGPCGDVQTNRITNLDLRSNGLKGELPPELVLLTALEVLKLSHNELYGTIPIEIFLSMKYLRVFKINDNQFSGQIPTEIGHLQQGRTIFNPLPTLEEFNVENNDLVGTIPTEIGLHTDLHTFDVGNNRLGDYIPSEIIFLEWLEVFDVHSNALLPFQFSNLADKLQKLHSLTILDVSNNTFSGTLPTFLSSLTNLELFDVSYNSLSGEVPREYETWTSIRSMHLEGNEIRNSLPQWMCGGVVNITLEVYVTCLQGCKCCSHCCDNNGYCEDDTSRDGHITWNSLF